MESNARYIIVPRMTVLFRNQEHPYCPVENPFALIVQVLSALTEGVGINAASTALWGEQKQHLSVAERLGGLKKPCSCLP